MIYEGSSAKLGLMTPSDVWSDWLFLSQHMFSDIQNKIRQRRRMYKLDWEPDEPGIKKRWVDYVIDPLPRNNIDFKADRLTMRPLVIQVPNDQMDTDVVSLMDRNGMSTGTGAFGDPNQDITAMIKKMKELGQEMAEKRADSIEKFLHGTLYINQVSRKENLQARWATHLLVDGYAAYIAYLDANATEDEYPIVIRALDPLNVVYQRGDQKLEKLLIGRQDMIFNLRREFGSDMFREMKDDQTCNVIDWWCRVKVRKTNPVDGTKRIIAQVWHATYVGFMGVNSSSGLNNRTIDSGAKNSSSEWFLKPSLTDYTEIPGDVIEARINPLTESPSEMVTGDLDGAEEIWNSRNYLLSRMNKMFKMSSGGDLITKGISNEVSALMGQGNGITVQLPADSPVNADQAATFVNPPSFSPNIQAMEIALNAMNQQSLIPVTSLGNRGGTVSGAQVNSLDQGASVRIQPFVAAMNLVNTSWARNVMQIAKIHYTDPNQKIPIYGIDRNSNPFVTKIGASDINGDYTVFVNVNPRTSMEQLEEAVMALQLHRGNPTDWILSAQTIREQFLGTQFSFREKQLIRKEAIELNEWSIGLGAQQGLVDMQMSMLQQLKQLETQMTLQGTPPDPNITHLISVLQNSILAGAAYSSEKLQMPNMGMQGNPGPNGSGFRSPTNEHAALDARSNPGASPEQANMQMLDRGAQNGMTSPNGQY